MIKCPDVPLFSVGILGLKFITLPDQTEQEQIEKAYEMGRSARIAGLPRRWGSNMGPLIDHWQRGWDIVDYALNHPNA